MFKKLFLWLFVFLVVMTSSLAVIDWENDAIAYHMALSNETNSYNNGDTYPPYKSFSTYVNATDNLTVNSGIAIDSVPSFVFDGSSNSLYYNDTSNLGLSQETISAWVYFDDLGDSENVYQDETFFIRFNSDGTVSVAAFELRSGTGTVVSAYNVNVGTVNTGTWYHFAVSIDNTDDIKVYLNGVEYDPAEGTDGTSSVYTFAEWGVRHRTASPFYFDYFDGKMQGMAVFNRVLTQTEISGLYSAGMTYNPYVGVPPTDGFPYEVTNIAFSPSIVYPVDDVSAVVTLNDSVGADVKYYWLVNDVNITSGTITTSSGNDFSIPSLDSSNYGSDDTIKLDVYAVYESNNSQASDSYFETITTTNVSITALSISPSTLYTDTSASGSVNFDYGTGVVGFYEWIVNDVVVSSNYYSTTGSTYSIPSLSSSYFVQGDNVTLNVTPYSGSTEAIGLESSIYKIVTNRDPFFYNAFANPSVIIEDSGFDFACYFGDSDSDTLSIDWTLYRNDVEYDSSNDTATDFGSGVQGIVTSVAGVDSVEGDEWYIDCQAFDSFGGNTIVESSIVYTVEATPNFTVSVNDYWSGESVSTFWVYMDGVNYTTTSGLIITDVLRNDGKLHNYSVGANNYLLVDVYTNELITDNAVISLYQSIISFDSYELITGSLLDSDNDIIYTLTDGVVSRTKNKFLGFAPSNGTYNISASVDGYINKTISFTVSPLDSKTVNVTGVYDSLLNITPLSIFDNSTLLSFTGWVYDNNNSYNVSFSSDDGSVTIPLLKGFNISYFVNPSLYAFVTDSFIINETYYNLSTYHYTTNSIRINIYNDTTNNLLTQNVSIVGVFDSDSFVNSTLNGTLYVDLLTPEVYELRFSSSGFVDTSVFVTVTSDSTQEINVYMVSNASLELQRVLVVDDISEAVSGAIVRLQEQVPGVPGLWLTVDEKSTNSDGYSGFYVEKSTNVFYRFIVIFDGDVKLISDSALFLPGIDEVITLQISTLSDGADNLFDSIVKSFVWSGSDNETFTFSWVDPNNLISGARLEVWVEDLNISGVPPQLYLTNSSVLTTGSLSVTLPVVNDTIFTIKAYIVYSSFDEFVYTTTRVFGSTSLPDKELGLILSLIVFLFVAFITISLKPLFSSVLSFSVLGIMSAFHLIVLPVTIITSFIALAIIFFVKIKGGGN